MDAARRLCRGLSADNRVRCRVTGMSSRSVCIRTSASDACAQAQAAIAGLNAKGAGNADARDKTAAGQDSSGTIGRGRLCRVRCYPRRRSGVADSLCTGHLRRDGRIAIRDRRRSDGRRDSECSQNQSDQQFSDSELVIIHKKHQLFVGSVWIK